jgi:hypothetical protein
MYKSLTYTCMRNIYSNSENQANKKLLYNIYA